MWLAENISLKTKYPLIPQVYEYEIGRKDNDIVIEKDASISRVHAKIFLENGKYFIKDSSKYGTYIRGEKISQYQLKSNDLITFGIQNATFKFTQFCFHVTTSLLTCSKEINELKSNCNKLGITIHDNWFFEGKFCDFLVMPHLKITPKVLSALVTAKPIVTSIFFKDLLQIFLDFKVNKNPLTKPLFFADPYLPSIVDTSLLNFNLNPHSQRTKLFKGVCFAFISNEQYSKYQQIISSAKGNVCLVENLDNVVSLTQTGQTPSSLHYLIDYDSKELSEFQKRFAKEWNNRSVSISESNISCAILSINLTQYCPQDSSLTSNDLLVMIESLKNKIQLKPNIINESVTIDMGQDDNNDEWLNTTTVGKKQNKPFLSPHQNAVTIKTIPTSTFENENQTNAYVQVEPIKQLQYFTESDGWLKTSASTVKINPIPKDPTNQNIENGHHHHRKRFKKAFDPTKLIVGLDGKPIENNKEPTKPHQKKANESAQSHYQNSKIMKPDMSQNPKINSQNKMSTSDAMSHFDFPLLVNDK